MVKLYFVLLTLSICESHPLQVLLFDLAYSTWRSLRVTFLFLEEEEEEEEGPSVLSVPPPPEIFFLIFSWSSQRSELKPDISLMA